MKNNTIIKVMIVSFVMIVVGCIIAISCSFNGANIGISQVRLGPFGIIRWDKENTIEMGEGHTFHANSEISTFSIQANIVDVTIQRGTQFAVTTKNIAKKKITVEEQNGEFKLTVNNPHLSTNMFSGEQKIIVTVPEHVKVVNADINVGDIDIMGLALNTLTVNCNTGDIDIENVTSESATLNLDIGDLDFSGDVTKLLKVITHTGDSDITLFRNELSYNSDFKVNLGELSVNDQNHGEINASYLRNNQQSASVIAKVDLGDLDINFGYDD